MTHSRKQERLGEMLLIGETILFSLFPVIGVKTVKVMPPLLFAASVTMLSGVILLAYVFYKKEFFTAFKKGVLIKLMGVVTFNMVIAASLIFWGMSKTSAISTSIMLQMEIIFTLIISSIFLGEKLNRYKVIGALIIFFGAAGAVFDGTSFVFNSGDLLIIAGTIFYPFGNHCAKLCFNHISPVT
ncbi:MAG: DMT family transporter, partial [Patescibacteria group bacterium]